MKRARRLLVAATLACSVVAGAPTAEALSIAQHPLPQRCGNVKCTPAPASAIVATGTNRVLVSGVEGGTVYSEVLLGSKPTTTPGPAGKPAYKLARGLDGNPWALGRVGPDAAVLDVTPHGLATYYAYPSPAVQTLSLATGFGAAWVVTNSGVDRIGVNGGLTHLVLPGILPLHERARQIVVGPTESMWYTGYDGAIGQISSAGQIVEHSSEAQPLDPFRANPQPSGLAEGPDGAVWYTDTNHARIGRIAPSGDVREFQIPNHGRPSSPGPVPTSIVAGPEGQFMYFTDAGDNAIGRVAMSGEISEFPIPGTAAVGPDEITTLGSELVFDESASAAIGTVNPTAMPGEAPVGAPPATSAIMMSLKSQLSGAVAVATPALARSRHAFSLVFRPLEAGVVELTWTLEPHGASHQSRKPVVVATATATFDLPEPRAISVRVTPAGTQLLKWSAHRPRVRLAVQLAFSGYSAGRIVVSTHQRVAR